MENAETKFKVKIEEHEKVGICTRIGYNEHKIGHFDLVISPLLHIFVVAQTKACALRLLLGNPPDAYYDSL